MMDYERRKRAIRAVMDAEGMDGAIVLNPENIFYLTGSPFVHGSVGKILHLGKDGRDSLIVSDIDFEEVVDKSVGVEVVKTDFLERPSDRLKKIAGKVLGYEEGFVSISLRSTFSRGFTMKPLGGAIEKLREVKEKEEVTRIIESQRATEKALESAMKSFKEGMSELDIAAEIEYNMRKDGAEVYAFESLVASGKRGVYPHGIPSVKKVGGGDPVVIDIGVKVSGYCSDMTRTVFFGKPSEKAVNAYQAVKEAQEAALSVGKPGMKGKELDAIARAVLEARGYGAYFSHGLGHGVGIAVHEGPSAGPRGEDRLVPGNVVTVEPGVYLPKRFGIRIEDMILVKDGGIENLTSFTKDMLVF
jgi:Xaa-Pro aminopeptidase